MRRRPNEIICQKAVFEYTQKARPALFFRIFQFRILYTFSHRKLRIFIFAFYTSSNSHFRIFAFRILYVPPIPYLDLKHTWLKPVRRGLL